MKLKPYPAYKDSGVEWLGEVPTHWGIEPLKYSFLIVGGSTPKSDMSSYWDGEIVWVTPSDLSKIHDLFIDDSQRKITSEGLASCGTRIVPAGSIILSTRAPIGSLAVAKRDMCTNQGCKSLVPYASTNSNFFAYLLSISTSALNVRGKGTTFLELSGDELGFFKVPSPSNEDQVHIAAFLDRETAKLDTLISKQERLIELLQERIITTVSNALVSEESHQIRLSHVCDVISRPVIQNPEESYVRLGLLNRGRGIFKRDETDSDDMGDSDFFWVEKGDLIISGQFAWEGAVALADEEHSGCVVSHRFPVIRGKEGIVLTEYLFALFMTPFGDFILNENSRGSAGRNRPLNLGLLLKEKIPIPPLALQSEVAKLIHLKKQLVDKSKSQISFVQEHRSALISAAVTGKIDVREAA